MSFLSWNWWFQLRPPFDPMTLRWLFIIFMGFVIVGAAVRMVSKRRFTDRFWVEAARRCATLLTTIGVFGVLYWFFAAQSIPFFSAHFWLAVFLIIAAVWFWTIVYYVRKRVPEHRAQVTAEAEARRYMKSKHG